MKFTKDFSVKFISFIYNFEIKTTSLFNDNQEQINNIENLEQRVEKIIENRPNDSEAVNIKRELEGIKKENFELNEKIRAIKSGKDTIFDWCFIDDNSKREILDLISDVDTKKWILEKVTKEQKVIYAQIDINKISQFAEGEISLKTKIIDFFKPKEKTTILLLLNSPFNLKGKENAYIYYRNLTTKEEQIGKCNVADVISTNLLSVEDEIDLDILNNLKENNDLSKLYDLTYKESLNKNFNTVKSDILSNLEREINNISRKSKGSQ